MKLNVKVLIMIMAALAFTFTSCEQDGYTGEGYLINGTVSSAGGKSIFLDQMSLNSSTPFDTAIIANDGTFKMQGTVPERGLYMLRIDQEHTWLMVLENQQVVFTADYAEILDFSFEGSAASATLSEFIKGIGTSNKKISDLKNEYNQFAASGQGDPARLQQIQQDFVTLSTAIQSNVYTFTDTVSDPLLKVFAASLMNPEQNAEFLLGVNAELQKQIPNSIYAREFNSKMAEATKFSMGKLAPDFTLNSPKGEEFKLSDLRGQYVLIDFWASWCKPCRRENPNLVKTYNEYKSKGFTVYSVSLDKDLNRWVDAIKADGLTWEAHGSVLQAWNCPVAKKYNVSSIPQTFLVGPDGKIIAKNLRGAQLDQKLAEVFSES